MVPFGASDLNSSTRSSDICRVYLKNNSEILAY